MNSPQVPPTPNPDTQSKGVTVEEIVSGTRCSPLTLKEFEGFLIHEEHSVENLQFTVWYRSYCERFKALPEEYQALSEPPAERYTQFSTPAGSIRTAGSIKESDPSWWTKLVRRRSSFSGASQRNADMEKGSNDPATGTGLGVAMNEEEDDDNLSLRSAAAPETPQFASNTAFPTTTTATNGNGAFPNNKNLTRFQTGTFSDTSSVNTEKQKKSLALRFANLAPLNSIRSRKELPADTPLPFLEEVKLITTTFFLPGASKELNIDARLRRHILKSLQPTLEDGTKGEPVTTHPDVFKEAADHVYNLMERSLPHYLQWAKGNTNTPKRLFWTGVGIIDMGIGVMFAMIILFYARSRWWRIFSFLFFQFGAMQAYSAWFYFCSQVHGRTARQLYPWELSEMIEEPVAAPSNAFVVNMKPNAPGSQAAQNKGIADLQASLPFLFEPEPEKSDAANEKPKKIMPDGSEMNPRTAKRKLPNFNGGKFFASLKRKDGKRVPMFGPERVVEDPYIKYLHNKQMKEILLFGLVATFIFLCIVVALPEQNPR